MKSERLGQQVGSYEIVSLLGAGGMGEVYLARDATLGRKVALKFLPDFLLQDDTARRRFVQEAKLAAALDHPFLCKVYEIGEEDERVFISPEYVRGQKVDTRSDLFSFGVILYEMLTGEHPFRRSLAADTAVAILGKEPEPVGKLRPEVTEELESVLMKLLAKDREDRWQTVEEVRSSLAQLASDPSSSSMALAAGKGTAFSGLASRVALALVAVAAVAAAWLWFARPQPQVMLQPVPLTSLPGNERYPSFSPDGNEVAFAWSGKNQENSDIWVKQIDTETRRNLTDNPANDTAPAWSPDGLQIAFVRNLGGEQSEIRLIPSRGGTDHPVTEINARRTTLAWSRDSQWLAVSAGENSDEPWAIFLVSVETGEKRRLTSPDLSATGGDIFPAFSPDNRGLAFSRSTGGNNRHIYLLRLSADYQREGVPEQLTRETGFYGGPVWTLDGREIVFSFGSQINPRLYRISRFRLRADETPEPVSRAERASCFVGKAGPFGLCQRRGRLEHCPV